MGRKEQFLILTVKLPALKKDSQVFSLVKGETKIPLSWWCTHHYDDFKTGCFWNLGLKEHESSFVAVYQCWLFQTKVQMCGQVCMKGRADRGRPWGALGTAHTEFILQSVVSPHSLSLCHVIPHSLILEKYVSTDIGVFPVCGIIVL